MIEGIFAFLCWRIQMKYWIFVSQSLWRQYQISNGKRMSLVSCPPPSPTRLRMLRIIRYVYHLPAPFLQLRLQHEMHRTWKWELEAQMDLSNLRHVLSSSSDFDWTSWFHESKVLIHDKNSQDGRTGENNQSEPKAEGQEMENVLGNLTGLVLYNIAFGNYIIFDNSFILW